MPTGKKSDSSRKSRPAAKSLGRGAMKKTKGGDTAVGSATGGAGAGKIKFNEFTIKKTTDSASTM